ncbi:TSUP family transporter [Priestia megaterium]|nr:TSUP family transporter [Priestia megaterium]
MEELSLNIILLLLFFGFLAAFIDSVVGGGGLISTPALLFLGLPPAAAIATNKLAGTMGVLTSTISFVRSGKVDFRIVGKWFPFVFIGSFFGSITVHYLSSEFLKPLILVLLVLVAVYTILNRNWGKTSTYKPLSLKKIIIFTALIFIIGFYDGFLGAGTGSFILFAFLFVGFDFLQSAGSAKFLNFGSNLAALLVFLYFDSVVFSYGLIMGFAMIIGAYVGSNVALTKGVTYVRTLFILVTLSLIGKNVFDYIVSS